MQTPDQKTAYYEIGVLWFNWLRSVAAPQFAGN